MKKIFDVNALDLAKVGKAFGFSVPPRVNINMAPGKGTSTTSKGARKRPRDEEENEEVLEEMEVGAGAEEDADEDLEETSRKLKRNNKGRRIEALGQKKVDKEVYRKGKERKQMAKSAQWSR